MEENDRSNPEETLQKGLRIQYPAECQMLVDLVGFQSDPLVQRSEDPTLNEASKIGVTHETKKLVQQDKEPVLKFQTQNSLKKSEENKSYRQECRELSEDKYLEETTDANIVVQQYDGNSYVPEQDSSQMNQPEAHVHQECDVLGKDMLLESDGNTAVQRLAEASESILHVPDQESIKMIQQKDSAADQEYSTAPESLQRKLETNSTEQLKEKSFEESLIVPFEDFLHSGEQKANVAVQQEYDRTAEKDQYFQESESDTESEESPLVCLQSWQPLPLPRRICYHRTRIMQRPRLPPVPEEPDLPLMPFEEEILIRRNRTLGARLLTMLPTGLRDFMRRIRERHFLKERRALYEDLKTMCVKLFCSLLLIGILVVAPYFLIDFSENKYNSSGDSVTSPLADFSVNLNIPAVTFKPDNSVTYLEANITTTMDDLDVNINNLAADFDTEISSVLNDMNANSTET